ncbi:MAG: pyridoxamine 5'-phosphate oxidase family protein [Desulfarculaceae bacterium]|nr:pyridoxamine 5'-phosphate oxidase family protein [Desulfarculaceae bacterium]
MEKMLSLIRSQNLAVLATQGEGAPRASLMSYLWDDEGKTLYLISREDSRKFVNLMERPLVSLLIDDRADAQGLGGVKALSVEGEAGLLDDPAREAALKQRFAKELPHLAELANDPRARVVAVRAKTLLVLDGPTEATRLELA